MAKVTPLVPPSQMPAPTFNAAAFFPQWGTITGRFGKLTAKLPSPCYCGIVKDRGNCHCPKWLCVKAKCAKCGLPIGGADRQIVTDSVDMPGLTVHLQGCAVYPAGTYDDSFLPDEVLPADRQAIARFITLNSGDSGELDVRYHGRVIAYQNLVPVGMPKSARALGNRHYIRWSSDCDQYEYIMTGFHDWAEHDDMGGREKGATELDQWPDVREYAADPKVAAA